MCVCVCVCVCVCLSVLYLTVDNRHSITKTPILAKLYSLHIMPFCTVRCGHCKKLAPEYEKAATELKTSDPSVPLAKVRRCVRVVLQ